MMDEEKNNLRDIARSKQVDDEYLPPDAKPLCPECLQPCDPLQYYCTNCDSNEAINPLSAYMPYVRIRLKIGFYGKLWRRIIYDSDISIIVKLAFLLFLIFTVPLIVFIGFPAFIITKIFNIRD